MKNCVRIFLWGILMTPILSFLIQIFVDVLFIVGFVLLWLRLKKPPAEDPRLSAGIQVLQNKIAVLEDLGDRTETQVQQLTQMLENKLLDVQKKMDQADVVLSKISQSMEKSIEVAKIFQDKIPHDEIIERQNTVKFVKAALLANQGKNSLEIAEEVDLSMGEIDFIVKVNKDELSFDEEQLPEWVVSELKESKILMEKEIQMVQGPLLKMPFKTSAGISNTDQEALHQLGEKFRQAQFLVAQHKAHQNQIQTQAQTLQADNKNAFQPLVFNSTSKMNAEFDDELTEPTLGLTTESTSTVQSVNVLHVSKQEEQTPKSSSIIKAKVAENTGFLGNDEPVGSVQAQLTPKAKDDLVSKLIQGAANDAAYKIDKNSKTTAVNQVKPLSQNSIATRAKELGIRPVVFPKIEKVSNKNL